MNVKELIAILKKMPKEAEVATTAHDNGELEIQGHVNYVYEVEDFDELRAQSQDANTESDFGMHGNYVILSN